MPHHWLFICVRISGGWPWPQTIYLFDFIDIQAGVSSAYPSRPTSGLSPGLAWPVPVITERRPVSGECRHGKLIKLHSNDWLRAIINSSINYSTCPNSKWFYYPLRRRHLRTICGQSLDWPLNEWIWKFNATRIGTSNLWQLSESSIIAKEGVGERTLAADHINY